MPVKRGASATSGSRAVHAPLPGQATPAGTADHRARFAPQFAPDFFRTLAGLSVSSLGLGTYLGEPTDEDDARYAASTRTALAAGINLLDSAINYRCQRSERAVGRALRDAVADGVVRREEVVVCTKGGYLPLDGEPPPTREAYDDYVRREYLDPGIVRPDELVGGGHSLAPDFLADQLARSRANLGVETIDLYYLHNPEQQLAGVSPARLRERLRGAFVLLEECAGRGEIAAYGCATWHGLRVPPGTRGHMELGDLVALAREVGGTRHHFRAVQLPVSLAMAEAVRLPTQPLGGRPVPLLEAALALGVGVVVSAPLAQGRLAAGLPDEVRESFPALATDAQRALAFARGLPGVCAVLAGMRSAMHVEENLAGARVAVALPTTE
ncbi:MAG TPA: aldo/keto reductase [Gemmatimonadaceae bacterium]|nr:aldo/keto reductase [Gemmatimonadaceae bacterium]